MFFRLPSGSALDCAHCQSLREVLLEEGIDDEYRQDSDECDRHSDCRGRQIADVDAARSVGGQKLNILIDVVQNILDGIKQLEQVLLI